MLLGREAESARIHGVVAGILRGEGGSLVLRGDPGIGKSALLDDVRGAAAEALVVTTRGVETEAELAFAALGDVLRPLLPALDRLAELQVEVIEGVLGIAEARRVDRLAIGAATLSLLAAAAVDRALVVIVDDAHWLDEASADALVFAARRLDSDPIAILFAAREGDVRRFAAEGVPELEIAGLSDEDSRLLLGPRVRSREVVDELIRDTGGNPLALLELPGMLGDAQLAGDEPIDRPLKVGDALERSFARRVLLLGDDVRRAVLVAAAEETGSASVVSEAIGRLELPPDALTRAEDEGLLHLDGPLVGFRHPLVRSAVYHGAAPSERRAVHAALADVLSTGDPERSAWHLAGAAVGEDATAGDALAAVAASARGRAAYAAAAAAFQRASRLGPCREWCASRGSRPRPNVPCSPVGPSGRGRSSRTGLPWPATTRPRSSSPFVRTLRCSAATSGRRSRRVFWPPICSRRRIPGGRRSSSPRRWEPAHSSVPRKSQRHRSVSARCGGVKSRSWSSWSRPRSALPRVLLEARMRSSCTTVRWRSSTAARFPSIHRPCSGGWGVRRSAPDGMRPPWSWATGRWKRHGPTERCGSSRRPCVWLHSRSCTKAGGRRRMRPQARRWMRRPSSARGRPNAPPWRCSRRSTQRPATRLRAARMRAGRSRSPSKRV